MPQSQDLESAVTPEIEVKNDRFGESLAVFDSRNEVLQGDLNVSLDVNVVDAKASQNLCRAAYIRGGIFNDQYLIHSLKPYANPQLLANDNKGALLESQSQRA